MKKIKIIIIMALLICSTGCKTTSSLKEEVVPKISNETVKEESQGTNEPEDQSEDQSDEAIDEKTYMADTYANDSEVESVRSDGNQINEEHAISVIRNYIADEMRKQEELVYNAMGVWTLSDFYLPSGGPPSKDMAEDYLNKEITLSLSGDEISLFFNEKEYKMKYMKPVSRRYILDIYRISGVVDSICNNNAYEIGFTSEEETVKLFLNDTGGAFFHIEGPVADLSIFELSNKCMTDMVEEAAAYFEEKQEYLTNNCRIHYSYENIVLLKEGRFILNEIEYDMQMLSFTEECTININGDIIELFVGSFDLQLVKIEEVNSIIYQHSCWWKSDEGEYTLVYTFKGENSVIQIVETSKNKFFIISWANEAEEGNIYGHTE